MSRIPRRHPRHQSPRGTRSRPAIWAIAAALLCVALPAGAAGDSSGGFPSEPGGTPAQTSYDPAFGTRLLRVGMEGPDVSVLKGIIRSKPYVRRMTGGDRFDAATRRAVSAFQEHREIARTGVVDSDVAHELTLSMRRSGATWYGPGLYGNSTACGQVLRPGTVGVAHRSLPCGTRVTLAYRGRYLVTRVIDRGPYRRGYEWDLTGAAAERLGLERSDDLRSATAR